MHPQIDLARTYINKEEKPKNSGFKDPKFEAEMISLGEWKSGDPWCACFAQMIFRKTFPEKTDVLRKLFSPSTKDTFENFQKAGYPISSTPVIGALVVWAQFKGGKRLWTGHAGIVSEVIDAREFKSIEGNTALNGSRNGDRVLEQHRNTDIKSTGLNILGFISI